MSNELILGILLLIAAGGWAGAWFKYQQVATYLALKNVEMPTEEEWEKCAKAVWLSLWRKKK